MVVARTRGLVYGNPGLFCASRRIDGNVSLPPKNSNPVKIAASARMAGAYNLKKVLPRHVLQRRLSPQINLSAGTLE